MQGGIGNQLFCLAFAHSVARLSGGPVAIDLAAFRSSRYGHTFRLADIAAALGDIHPADRGWWGSRLTTALMRAAPVMLAAPWSRYSGESELPADEAALATFIDRGCYFNGYWQNEAYIARPEEFVTRAREHISRRAGQSRRREVVIHYRTYKEEIRAHARRTPGGTYVRAALARIEATLGRPAEVCLVSDDPSLALRTLGDIGRTITVVSGAGPWQDMAVLMRAQGVVLTNSSFSWWGGFCSVAELAVYPRADGFFHYPAPAGRFVCV